MNRPQHSAAGFLRSMQVSAAALFVFVESHTDRYFYSRIAESECRQFGIGFRAVAAEELPSGTGGKESLLSFFNYLECHSYLVNVFKGKLTVSIFFMDKDLDDFLGSKQHSEHIVYTETYELENYLFVHGELSEAAAVSASLELPLMRATLGDYSSWRQKAATQWQDWVKLCFFSHTCKIRNTCNYGHPKSLINDNAYSPVDTQKYQSHLSSLQSCSNLTPTQFNRLFEKACHRVDDLYSGGQHDLVFKGKWYACFLIADIRKVAAGRRYNRNYLERRLLSNLTQTLTFSDAWAEYFRAPTATLLSKVGIRTSRT